jgi:hypothetical protein
MFWNVFVKELRDSVFVFGIKDGLLYVRRILRIWLCAYLL